MFENTNFDYLDENDTRDFEDSWEEYQDILVAGSKTSNRLHKYLPENE